MTKRQLLTLLLTIALVFSMLTGCGKSTETTSPESATPNTAESESPGSETESQNPETEESQPEEPELDEDIPIRYKNKGVLSFLPEEPITIPKFSEMECEKIDVEPLLAKMDALIEKAKVCEDADEFLSDYYAVLPELYHYYQMSTLSYIRYTQDHMRYSTKETFDYFLEPDELIAQKDDELCEVLAESPMRDDLEKAYFSGPYYGEDFFDDYEPVSEEYWDLSMQEGELFQQYYDLTADGIYINDNNDVARNHDSLAELFVEMVKVRNQQAIELGYENYMEYAYPKLFQRDYSPEEIKEFLKQVKTCLVPLAKHDEIWDANSVEEWLPDSWRAYAKLQAFAKQMGGTIWDAFRFMNAYELYDIATNARKMNVAYVNYLPEYETPVIIINGGSYTTFAHEFGHFVDRFDNYNEGSSDISEIYSQLMEYLYLKHDDVPQEDRNKNIQADIGGTLTYAIFRECAYADFELQVYELAPEELTPENIDAIFFECMKNYGVLRGAEGEIEGKRWIAYHHFFDRAGYVIGYATSAIAVLEICAMDAENPGAGLDAFNRLLDRTPGKQFSAVIEEAGLENPFEASTLNKIAEFIKKTFELE